MKTVVYKKAGGCAIHADVYPLESEPHPPVIVWIHGGALIGGNRRSMNRALRQLFTQTGFAQVSIDYRLAPETKLPEIIADVHDAFDWVRGPGARSFGWNPRRVGVTGGSAGGYLTLMTGYCLKERPKALAAFYGYGDIGGPWYAEPDPFYLKQPLVTETKARSVLSSVPLSEQPDKDTVDRFRFYLYCRQQGTWPEEVSGFSTETQMDQIKAYCPAYNVDAKYPPTLLLHGTADTDVPYSQSVQMAEMLKAGNIKHELITIEGGGHGFDGKARVEHLDDTESTPALRSLYRTLAWMCQYV